MKAVGLTLIAVILGLMLSCSNKHFSLLLSICVCCMVGISAVNYLRPVIAVLDELQSLGGWNREYFSVLLKTVGLGMITEIAVLICTDSGNTALGKVVQLMANAVMLWLALPLFTALMELISEILGGL